MMIETRELTKYYGLLPAVDRLNLTVRQGSIHGFLGRNGAGKTTTLKMLMGMTRPTSGEARVFSLLPDDPADGVAIRRRTGFVAENRGIYPYFTVAQTIDFVRDMYRDMKTGWCEDLEQKYLRCFELPLKQRIKDLSKGTQTRLWLLLALCHGAELLILDEPTSGLDPEMQEMVLQALVRAVVEEGVTVFFSTHHISEVEQIADHVTIIEAGRVAVDGTIDDLRESYKRVHVVMHHEGAAPDFELPGVKQVECDGRRISVLASHNVDAIIERARSLPTNSVEVTPVSLKEIFLATVRKERV